jgi:dihydroorotase
MRGEEPADYEAQRRAGAGAVSDDGLPVRRDEVMAACMAGAAAAGLPIFDHATHGPDSPKGVVNDGQAARERGLPGLPREEEDELVERNVRIAEETGHPVHISHLSTARSLAAVKRARERGVPVTAEVTPHHLLLTDRDATTPDHKMNPPLRTEEDRLALVRELGGGAIDAVATDHAPHAPELKARGMLEAPFGVIGMETAWPVLYTRLVRDGTLPLGELLRLFTSGPARVGRIPGGRLADGERAEVNLIDLSSSYTVEAEGLRSRSRNCPFLGWEVAGRIAATVAGRRATLHLPERFRSR